jgi:enoyl-CoA hydratase/carnithine racemase
VFCAGHDLKEMTAQRADADGGRAYFAKVMAACGAMVGRDLRSCGCLLRRAPNGRALA